MNPKKRISPHNNDLVKEGDLVREMIHFSVPFLIACFLQSFYGVADLYITGIYYGAEAVSAVAIGSQVMHMLTVAISGLAVGITVCIGRAIGAGETKIAGRYIGNAAWIFTALAILGMMILIPGTGLILDLLSTPKESFHQARSYLAICFAGIPFIIAYNTLSAIYRGMGDTVTPLTFVGIAGILNIVLDYYLIGHLKLGASGAAIATVLSQMFSVGLNLIHLKQKSGIHLNRNCFIPEWNTIKEMLQIGIPVLFQDGMIQISFLVITAIANSRGLYTSAAVGIVEKIISFLFLVHSAMLSTVSALAAQNNGAGQHERARDVLRNGIIISVSFGIAICVLGQVFAPEVIRLFSREEPMVALLGTQYFRAYLFDCIFAGIHFCFSGYFCAYSKSGYSFLHNILSICMVRIPGTYIATKIFPENLFPMGLASGLGSLFSSIICLIIYFSRFQAAGRPLTEEMTFSSNGKS